MGSQADVQTRPLLSIELSQAIFKDLGFTALAYQGLHEVPLGKIYPHLNLSDTLTFAAGSWLLRHYRRNGIILGDQGKSIAFLDFLECNPSLYQLVHKVQATDFGIINCPQNIFVWLNGQMKDLGRLKEAYDAQNPYGQQHNLEERLGRVGEADVHAIMQAVSGLTLAYYAEDRLPEDLGTAASPYKSTWRPSTKLAAYVNAITVQINSYPREWQHVDVT